MHSEDEFPEQLRDALRHLYDYGYLENHPLAIQCWPEGRLGGPNRGLRLHRLLLESIEELPPPAASSADATRALCYRLLVFRFVDEWSPQDIMREMGYSRRQFFREQRKAIALLAALLSERLPQPDPSATTPGDALSAEVERFLNQQEPVDLRGIVQGALDLASLLAQQHEVALECSLDAELPPICGSRTLLRQAFLNSLSSLITSPGTRRVSVALRPASRRIAVELGAEPGTRVHPPGESTGPPRLDLGAPRRLVELAGGRWQGFETRDGRDTYRFDFPVDGEKTLLVVEDNEGVILSFRRYLAGYNYRVLGATTGAEALRLAREAVPTAITLDVMMPAQDGWEVLRALKSDPVTQSIPVIICSVLEDPGLARSLGASAYLGKPVTQADLVAALGSIPGGR